jgi:hypothetical protein
MQGMYLFKYIAKPLNRIDDYDETRVRIDIATKFNGLYFKDAYSLINIICIYNISTILVINSKLCALDKKGKISLRSPREANAHTFVPSLGIRYKQLDQDDFWVN